MIIDKENSIAIGTDDDFPHAASKNNNLRTFINGSYYMDKIIHVSAKKKGFFYLRNKHGAKGKFKPTEEEHMYIMEKLISE